MTYPQPSSEKYVTGGYEYFRLNTLLSSPGDIYESLVSGLGMALGPQSDIANVNVAYFDSQAAPTFMNFTVVSPGRSFVGRLDARNELVYTPAGRPGRVLLWSDDLYDPNYRPRAAGDEDLIEFIAPRLDVIQYFANQPSLVPARQDKSYLFQNYILGAGGTLYLVVPYYGRKFAYVNFTNRDTVVPITIGYFGLNYAITDDFSANPYHQEVPIRAPAAVAAGATISERVTAAAVGMFDALVFSINGAGPAPLKIVVSDVAQGV